MSQDQALTDQDIDWLIGLMQRKSQFNIPSTIDVIRHDSAMELLEADLKSKRPTPMQKEKIFDATIPLLASKEESGLDVIEATNILRLLNDRRAIPLLLPLMNSDNPNVKTTVQNSLKVMGYTSGK